MFQINLRKLYQITKEYKKSVIEQACITLNKINPKIIEF